MNRLLLTALLLAACAAPAPAGAEQPSYAAQVSEANGVKITAQFLGSPTDVRIWEFEVRLETHTHPLDEDLARVSQLLVNGEEYAPLAWEGAPPGGHHRKGALRFRAVSPPPATLELRIRLNGEAAPRKFSWPLHAPGAPARAAITLPSQDQYHGPPPALRT